MKISYLKKQFKFEPIIHDALERYNDMLDEYELAASINSYEELCQNSSLSKKELFRFYNEYLFIGINKIKWISGEITYQEVYLYNNKIIVKDILESELINETTIL